VITLLLAAVASVLVASPRATISFVKPSFKQPGSLTALSTWRPSAANSRLYSSRRPCTNSGDWEIRTSQLALNRRLLFGTGLAVPIVPSAVSAADDPEITAKCFLDIRLGFDSTVPLRRVVIGLFGKEAPGLTQNFIKACTGTYPGRAGRQARYELAKAKAIAKNKFILWANYPGGSFLGYKPGKNKAGVPVEVKIPLGGEDTLTDETNTLIHDVPGRVSMPRGGGTFDFFITPVANAKWLDSKNVVIGQVLEGMDVIADMNKVPTALKGGILNEVSKGNEDILKEPLQRVQIYKSGLLT